MIVNAHISGAGVLTVVGAGGQVLWAGQPCDAQGMDPTKDGAEQWIDPLGPPVAGVVVNSNGGAVKRKAGGLVRVAAAHTANDLILTFTVATKDKPLPFIGFKLGASVGAPAKFEHPLGLMNFNVFQGAPMRWRLAWPSEDTPVRAAAWKTPTAQYCWSVPPGAANSKFMETLFVETGPGEPFAVVRANQQPNSTATYKFRLRIVPAAAPLINLLDGLSRDIRDFWGLPNILQYFPNSQSVVHWIRCSRSAAGPDNKYGFTPEWRPDENVLTATAWTQQVAENAYARGYQGVIAHGGEATFALTEMDAAFWGQAIDGADLRWEAKLWWDEAFRKPLEFAGLKYGCTQRWAMRHSQDANGVIRWWQARPEDLELMDARRCRAGQLLYVDSFPGPDSSGVPMFESAKLVKLMRERAGGYDQWWFEKSVDIFWPFAGVYMDLPADRQVPFHIDVLRAVCPSYGVLANDSWTSDFRGFRAWCREREFAAYVPDWLVGSS